MPLLPQHQQPAAARPGLDSLLASEGCYDALARAMAASYSWGELDQAAGCLARFDPRKRSRSCIFSSKQVTGGWAWCTWVWTVEPAKQVGMCRAATGNLALCRTEC